MNREKRARRREALVLSGKHIWMNVTVGQRLWWKCETCNLMTAVNGTYHGRYPRDNDVVDCRANVVKRIMDS